MNIEEKFTKDGIERTAYSPTERVRFIADGWTRIEDEVAAVSDTKSKSKDDDDKKGDDK